MGLLRGQSPFKNNNKNAAAKHNSEVAVKRVKNMDLTFETLDFKIFSTFFFHKVVILYKIFVAYYTQYVL